MVCVQTCCGCWDTRRGCIMIGYITGALSAVGCVGSILRLIMGVPLVLLNDDTQGQFDFNPLFFVFGSAYFAFHTVASFTLVPAVKEAREMFTVPAIVMLLVDIVLDFTAIIVIFIEMGKNYPYDKILLSAGSVTSILLPLLIYSTLILFSHFEQSVQGSDKVPLQKTQSQRPQHLSAEMEDSSEKDCGTIV
ncbi:uncharacterized protein LOC129217076 [Uloborus diversus]|uniref:uncharacterized protein LOC129217076 n=1 Tax=Uloborus diversus TaxID=327109 RepID=UPI00240A4B1C|nr:uncharacterized protein LOC129217076 [Uloborus diversus]